MDRGLLFRGAGQLLLMALLALVAMVVLAVARPEGAQVLQAFGGLEIEGGGGSAVRIAYALDTLFPIFYGSGLAVFLSALSQRSNRPLVRILILAVLIAAASDLIENRYIYLYFRDGQALPDFVYGLTALKYGLLVLASAGLSALLPEPAGRMLIWTLRFILPVAMALALAQFGGKGSGLAAWIAGLPLIGFAYVLGGLIWFCLRAGDVHGASDPRRDAAAMGGRAGDGKPPGPFADPAPQPVAKAMKKKGGKSRRSKP